MLCFFLASVYVLLYSYSTSIYYPYFYGNDTAHFMTIGKCWLEGLVPYRDLFDHKGPFIYFVNMIGFYIGDGDKSGISIIQIVFMTFFLVGIFKISQLAKKDFKYGVSAVLLTLLFSRFNYWEGNTVEEYCLPFLAWSLYTIILYIRNPKEDLMKWYSFLWGTTASVCLMTRCTNFTPLLVGLFYVFFHMLYTKRILEIKKNVVAFISGLVIWIIPFLVYFYINDSLEQIIFSVLTFNFTYAKSMNWLSHVSMEDIRNFIITNFLAWIIFLPVLIRSFKHDYKIAMLYLLVGMINVLYLCNVMIWIQYPLVFLPQVVLVMNEIISINKIKNNLAKWVAIVCAILIVMQGYSTVKRSLNPYEIYCEYSIHKIREWEPLVHHIPPSEYDSFVAYGGNETKEIYLLTGMHPYYKYYMIQEFLGCFSDDVKKDIHDIYNNGDVKWILNNKNENKNIQDVLNNRYKKVAETKSYVLYDLRN